MAKWCWEECVRIVYLENIYRAHIMEPQLKKRRYSSIYTSTCGDCTSTISRGNTVMRVPKGEKFPKYSNI